MRFSPPALALAAIFTLTSSTIYSQQPKYDPDPRSVLLANDGQTALQTGDKTKARDYFEAALAIDPGNRAAFLGLAETARAQGRPGQAIAFYRRVLELEPNNITALSGQGRAFVQRGALEKAKLNLTRLENLCGAECLDRKLLAASLAESEQKAVVSAEAVTPKPTATKRTETP
jgi:Tfp pilus assembly protein PilF